jgi:hypothetical protein
MPSFYVVLKVLSIRHLQKNAFAEPWARRILIHGVSKSSYYCSDCCLRYVFLENVWITQESEPLGEDLQTDTSAETLFTDTLYILVINLL